MSTSHPVPAGLSRPEAPPSLDNFVAGGNGEALTALAHWLSPDSSEPSFVL